MSRDQFNFGARTVMSADTFKSLRTVKGEPSGTYALPPYQAGKALIERDGRKCWHTVERQYRFGQPLFFASEIVVRLYAGEDA